MESDERVIALPFDPVSMGIEARSAFLRDGFSVFSSSALSPKNLELAREHLRDIFRGIYDLGRAPTKSIKKIDEHFTFELGAQPVLRHRGTPKRVQTLHVINAWWCDSFFRRLATSPELGALVAHLCGWEERGCRFAQDQVWVKPPGAGPLSFHRDTTYFDFKPKEVATVWFALDNTFPIEGSSVDVGPLEYCAGSHRWGFARRGSVNQFFDPDYHCMLRDAAAKEASTLEERDSTAAQPNSSLHGAWLTTQNLAITRVNVEAGGFSVHDGNTWHGSGPNTSPSQFRRGIGLHYIPGDAIFDVDDLGSLWRPFCEDLNHPVPPDTHFPWVWRPAGQPVDNA